MEKLSKVLSKHSTYEVIHLWCNFQLPKSITKGDYRFEVDSIRHNSYIIARVIDKKIYLVPFNSGSRGWGNSLGFSRNSIIRCIPNDITYYKVNKFPDFTKSDDEKAYELKQLFLAEVNEQFLNTPALLKYALNNNRLQHTYLHEGAEFYPNRYMYYGKRAYNKFINLKIDYNSTYTKYQGWSGYINSINSLKLSFKIKDLFGDDNAILYIHKLLSPELLAELEFRHFANSYRDRDLRTLELRGIYNSDRREQFIQDEQAKVNERVIKERKAKEEGIIKALKAIPKFRNSTGLGVYLGLSYVVFRLDGNIIKSSLGISITIPEVKLALKLFKLEDKAIGRHILSYVYRGVIIKEIPKLINDELVYQEERCHVVGCHVIPESEITDFEEFYNIKLTD
jgi:hypothetical protein